MDMDTGVFVKINGMTVEMDIAQVLYFFSLDG